MSFISPKPVVKESLIAFFVIAQAEYSHIVCAAPSAPIIDNPALTIPTAKSTGFAETTFPIIF